MECTLFDENLEIAICLCCSSTSTIHVHRVDFMGEGWGLGKKNPKNLGGGGLKSNFYCNYDDPQTFLRMGPAFEVGVRLYPPTHPPPAPASIHMFHFMHFRQY
jgi:hypothetical protein